MIRVEADVVVDRVPLDEVFETGQAITDAVISGGLGDLVVGPLRQAHDVDRHEVLGGGLLLGRDPGDATEVDRLAGVVRLRRHDRRGVRVRLVAQIDTLGIGHSGLAGADTFECCEHAARMWGDPHVDHRVLAAGVDTLGAVAVGVGDPDHAWLAVGPGRPAKVAVVVPLHGAGQSRPQHSQVRLRRGATFTRTGRCRRNDRQSQSTKEVPRCFQLMGSSAGPL